MSTKTEKLTVAGLALFFIGSGAVLLGAGTFLPHWAVVANSSVHGNVSFSLWTRRECFDEICVTEHVTVKWSNEECWLDKDVNRERCRKTNGTKLKSNRKCRPAHYCNHTWFVDADMDNFPSMLIVAKACEAPAFGSALVCILLYIIKVVLLVKRPLTKRLHLKTAYLTFGAIAGVVALVGVTLFCTMLEGDKFNREWAPFVCMAGGLVFVLFSFGGYLRWRDNTADGDFEDDNSSLCEKGSVDPNHIRMAINTSLMSRQTSQTCPKAAEAQL